MNMGLNCKGIKVCSVIIESFFYYNFCLCSCITDYIGNVLFSLLKRLVLIIKRNGLILCKKEMERRSERYQTYYRNITFPKNSRELRTIYEGRKFF